MDSQTLDLDADSIISNKSDNQDSDFDVPPQVTRASSRLLPSSATVISSGDTNGGVEKTLNTAKQRKRTPAKRAKTNPAPKSSAPDASSQTHQQRMEEIAELAAIEVLQQQHQQAAAKLAILNKKASKTNSNNNNLLASLS